MTLWLWIITRYIYTFNRSGQTLQKILILIPTLTCIFATDVTCNQERRTPRISCPVPFRTLDDYLITLNVYLQMCSVSFLVKVEFYLFVSQGCMKDRGSMCKFRNARSAFRNLHVDLLLRALRNLHVDPPVFNDTMRNKRVEFNPYIYTFFKIVPFWLWNIRFNRAVFRTAAGAAGSYATATVPWKMDIKLFLMFIVAETTGVHIIT